MAFTMVDFAGLNGHGAFHNGRETITTFDASGRPLADRAVTVVHRTATVEPRKLHK